MQTKQPAGKLLSRPGARSVLEDSRLSTGPVARAPAGKGAGRKQHAVLTASFRGALRAASRLSGPWSCPHTGLAAAVAWASAGREPAGSMARLMTSSCCTRQLPLKADWDWPGSRAHSHGNHRTHLSSETVPPAAPCPSATMGSWDQRGQPGRVPLTEIKACSRPPSTTYHWARAMSQQ